MTALVWEGLERLLARQASAVTSIEVIRMARASARAAVKVTFANGRVLKGRRLQSAEAAATCVRLGGLAPAGVLAPVVEAQDDTLLEAWVDGVVVADLPDDSTSTALARDVGRLLGRVADVPLPPELGRPRVRPVDIDDVLGGVQWLQARDVLAADEACAIEDCVRASCPPSAEYGLGHYDVTPGNVVRVASGALVLIDNESVRVDALDFDLARTLARWPFDAPAREAFLDGYREHRSLASFAAHQDYWSLLSLVGSVQFAVREGSPRLEVGRRALLAQVDAARARVPSTRVTVTLGMGQGAVAVTAEPADHVWLEDFVVPWLVPGHAAPVRAHVILEPPQAAVIPEEARQGREVSTFVMDKADGACAALSFHDGAGTLEDHRRSVRLHVVPPRVYVEAVDRDDIRLTAARLTRDLALHAEHGVCLHASAFVLDGTGVVALGPKRSGKTSLLLQALAEGAAYVTNDRLLLHEREGRCRFHGIPTVVSIRRGVLARTPTAEARYTARPTWYCHTEAECDEWVAREGAPLIDIATPSLSPRQLCTIFGASPRADLEPSLLVFPTITPGARGLETRRLDAVETLQRLHGAILGMEGRTEAFLAGQPPPPVPLALLERLSTVVPAFALAVGADAWDAPRPVTGLLASLSTER